MKVAIYSRVSTAEQEVENQLQVLENWANSRGWEIAQIYQEQESAWKAGHQKELARLKVDAGKRKFDAVLVWALDRLSREGAAAILNLVDTFKIYGVKVYSYQESWTEAPGDMGEMLYAIAGWVAKMESQRISERTRAGMERARKYGTKSGIPIGKRGRDKKKRRRREIIRPIDITRHKKGI